MRGAARPGEDRWQEMGRRPASCGSPGYPTSMALGRLRRTLPELELAFTGQFTDHHGRLIALSLELIDLLERQRAALDEQIRLLVEPLLPQIAQLDSIPGVDAIAARDILGEIGRDMSRFGSAAR